MLFLNSLLNFKQQSINTWKEKKRMQKSKSCKVLKFWTKEFFCFRTNLKNLTTIEILGKSKIFQLEIRRTLLKKAGGRRKQSLKQ